MLDLAILGLLREHDRHGYELRKQLAELLGARGAMSFGSLYPALARLEQAGLVKAVEANTRTDRPVPSSGSLAGELAAFRARRAVRPPPAAAAGRSTASPRPARPTCSRCSPSPASTTAPSPCRSPSAATSLPSAASPCSRPAGPTSPPASTATRPAGPLDRYLRSLRDRDDRTPSPTTSPGSTSSSPPSGPTLQEETTP